jgi:hypothetical protein
MENLDIDNIEVQWLNSNNNVSHAQDDGSDNESDGEWEEEEIDGLTVHEVTGGDRGADDANLGSGTMRFICCTWNYVCLNMYCVEEGDLDGPTPIDNRRQSHRARATFQQPMPWKLKHLPYYSKVEEQADKTFADIKAGIANSILMRDLRCGLLHWCAELQRFD